MSDRFSSQPGARLYRTGDLVQRNPDGSIEFLRRIDQQVKLRGFHTELGEIEAALQQCVGVRQCAVTLQTKGRRRRASGSVCSPIRPTDRASD